MTQFFPASAGTYNLNSSIGSTDTSFTLSSFLLPVSGVQITMALLNSAIAYGTIAPKTTSAELISFTGITANSDGTSTLTGVTRGLNKTYPYTSSSTFKLPHSGQSIFILSDAPQVFNQYASTTNDQTFAGVNTFTQSPIVPDPLSALQVANKEYVDNIALAGAPNASTTVKGVGEVSVAPVSPTTPIFIGQNDPVVPTQGENDALVGNNTDIAVGTGNKFVTQTGLQHSAEQYAVDSSVSANTITMALSPIPTSYTDGMEIKVKVANTTTSATTVNINALGGKTVKKYVNGAIADLTTNDILANQTVTMVYNAGLGFMILQSPVANTSTIAAPLSFISPVTSETGVSTAKNTDTTFTMGFTPKIITINYFLRGSSGGGTALSFGVVTYDGTTLKFSQPQLTNVPDATNKFQSTTITSAFTFDSSTIPSAGSLISNNIKTTLSILSVTSTGFTVRVAYTITGSPSTDGQFSFIAQATA